MPDFSHGSALLALLFLRACDLVIYRFKINPYPIHRYWKTRVCGIKAAEPNHQQKALQTYALLYIVAQAVVPHEHVQR